MLYAGRHAMPQLIQRGMANVGEMIELEQQWPALPNRYSI